jgi:para-aminobenzoate synthetase component I
MRIGPDNLIRLDSSDGSADWNFGPSAPTRWLWFDEAAGVARLADASGSVRQWADPLAALNWMAANIDEPGGRWIGYLSYDLGRWFERLPARSADDLGLPLFVFTYHTTAGPRPTRPSPTVARGNSRLRSNFSRRDYQAAVAQVIEFIRAGDVFQVNLSQRFSSERSDSPAAIYARLPAAAYGALLDYGDFALMCNSPELFLRVTPDRRVITRPIKGTRPRGAGMETELLGSAKDQAELNMIVDLERNDLGRVCRIGSVSVPQRRVIESHPTLYHGAATIAGTLRDDATFVDLLGATFPGGSVTGAPKIRAMQIIDELEPVRRGPYCGAVGYLAYGGAMEFNVAIRTMVAANGQIHFSVGGGIVADSDPAAEYEETLVKAQAMLAALGIQSHDGL